jgi:hypothetical protein
MERAVSQPSRCPGDGVGRSVAVGVGTTCDAPGFPRIVPRDLGSLGRSSTTDTAHGCPPKASLLGALHGTMRRRDRGGAPATTVSPPEAPRRDGSPCLPTASLSLATLPARMHLWAVAAGTGHGRTDVTVTSTPWTAVLSPISVFVPGLRTFTLAWVRSYFGHRPL